MKKILTIVSYYTEGYTYALKTQAKRVASSISQLNLDDYEFHYVACTDSHPATDIIYEEFKEILTNANLGFQFHRIPFKFSSAKDHIPYKEESQLMIAQMTQAVFEKARTLKSDYVWMIEADVLPAINTISCLLDVVNFDGGYYGIAFSPYTSNGGGSFLGGFGSPTNHIYKDFLTSERKLTSDIEKQLKKFDAEEKEFIKKKEKPSEDWIKRKVALEKKIDECPPSGNIWELNAKNGWRRRGWLDFCYPAISKGMIVPVDWCGTGNTLLTKKALEVSHMDGYPGQGTQDLFLIWHRWNPAGIKIGLTTQALADHVCRIKFDPSNRDSKRGDKIVHIVAYYETQGEAAGHIRWKAMPWNSSELGEKFDPKNDGKLINQSVNLNKVASPLGMTPEQISDAHEKINGKKIVLHEKPADPK
jgi:hypothetical protein